MPAYDLITFGETMIRLTVPDHARLEQATSLDVTIGGTESNVVTALARLGRQVAWLSALPDNALGRRIITQLRGHGVDTSHVVVPPDGRVGAYFLEPGASPRPTRVLYDRASSVVSLIDPEAIDPAIVQDAGALHLTGITPALSASCAKICLRLASAAANAGVPVVFDVNYRSRLWSPDEAAAGLHPLLQHTSVLLCGASDAATIWSLRGGAEGVAKGLLDRSSASLVVVTLGGQGAFALHRDGRSWSRSGAYVEIVDPIGAGDAFAAGFLHVWLANPDDVTSALRSGVALASLKMTMPGDLAVTTAAELDEAISLLDARGTDIDR